MSSPIVGDEIRNTEPATGEPLPPVLVSTPKQVQSAVSRARIAQKKWAGMHPVERRTRLLAFRDLLHERAEEMAESISRESGKVRFESLVWEVTNIVDAAHYYGTRANKLLRDEPISQHMFWPLKRGYVRYEPRGVVGVIAPWNFPLMLAMSEVLCALAARNAVVVKPSEWAPRSISLAREYMVAAGVDPDLFSVVQGGGETGATLIESGVDMVVFIGSVATGRKVAATCGAQLIPCVLELGGNDVAIVLSDVDIPHVAGQVVHGAFAASGQACASFERILVHESIHDAFVASVVEQTRQLRQGDPLSAPGEPFDLGAITMPNQIEIIERHVADARDKGAEVLTGGSRVKGPGRMFEPTVMTGVTSDMLCWNHETFGPTLPIRSFGTEDEAVEIANASDYGLNASVFSASVGKAEDLANRLEVGAVVVNDFFFNQGVPEAPWGGWKNSGVGRSRHGRDGLRHMSEMRFVSTPRPIPFDLPLRFPYKTSHHRFWRAVRRLLTGPFGGWV
jgi:acyl-CoA reductase-like NAD-dependent aldehyde dehydrogenase